MPKLRFFDLLYKPISKAVLIKKVETCFELQMQKQNERTYRRLLNQERREKEKYVSQVEEKEKRIGELSKQVSNLEKIRLQALQAIETPIQTISRGKSIKVLCEKKFNFYFFFFLNRYWKYVIGSCSSEFNTWF